jgi:protein SCO1/2
MDKKILLAAAAATLALALIAGLLFLSADRPLQGSVINPPQPAAPVELTNYDGQHFSLSNARGSVVLVYFGYTNCPDECPLTMAHLKLAMEILGARADRAKVVMVTTDPARDTPEALGTFMRRFNSAFMGLTGTPDQLAGIWMNYGVTVMNGGETHSNYIYVIDPMGNLVETFLPEAEPADIAADVKALLNRN